MITRNSLSNSPCPLGRGTALGTELLKLLRGTGRKVCCLSLVRAEFIGRAPGRGPEGTRNCSSCYDHRLVPGVPGRCRHIHFKTLSRRSHQITSLPNGLGACQLAAKTKKRRGFAAALITASSCGLGISMVCTGFHVRRTFLHKNSIFGARLCAHSPPTPTRGPTPPNRRLSDPELLQQRLLSSSLHLQHLLPSPHYRIPRRFAGPA